MPEDILSTCEIRWFGCGELPLEPIGNLLHSLNANWKEETPRTDHYLSLPPERMTGVKFREGKIEIKWLDAIHSSPEGWVAGALESWRKLSMPADQSPWVESSNWIAVQKRRRMLHWVLRNSHVTLANGDERAATCCVQEFSEVKIGRNQYWSICLEGVGVERLNCLNATLARLRKSELPEIVRACRVCSYPVILAE